MKRMLAMLALACVALAAMGAAAPKRPLRDPFARPVPPPAAASDTAELPPPPPPPPLHLRAVILNGARSIANIDGDIVGAGEQARDYTVIRIDARGVLVRRAGTPQLLTINEKDKQ